MLSKPLPSLRSALVCTISLVVTVSVAQTVRQVGPGQAYSTIQAGINAAVNGDTVLVAPGTYYENIDFKGKAITVTSSGGAAMTTIDGGKQSNTVVFQSGEPRSAVLSNFTVTHGIPPVNPNNSYTGGGVFIQGSQPTILNNVITQNYCQNVYSFYSAPLLQGNTISTSLTPESCVDRYTGGLMINGDLSPANGQPGAAAMVIGNTIEGNTTGTYTFGGGEGGAGIALPYGSPVIQNNVIRNNVTRGSGGGLYVTDGDHVSIIQNLIYGNSADCGGGGIASVTGGRGPDTYILVANNTLVGNVSSGNGRSTECRKSTEVWTDGYDGGGPTAKFVNNIIDGNDTPALDCGYNQGTVNNPIDEAHQSLFDHNLLFDSAGSFLSANCFDNSRLHGNVVADPQLVNAAGKDFHLKATSPAIDAGNGSVLQNLLLLSNVALTKDFDGNVREVDATGKGAPTIDMGAYEFAGVVDGAPTRIVLSSSNYTSNAGPVTLTATLSSALGVPTGPVAFSSDGIQIGVANAVNGVATLANVPFTPGVHVLLASYAGQGAYPAAVSVIVILDLDKYAGTLDFTSSPNPSVLGQPVTFNVHVAEPDGLIPSPITLNTGFNNINLATLQPDASGNATFVTSALPLGLQYIFATWPGDSLHNPLYATVFQDVVNGYPTNATLTCSPNSINIGASALFSAAVSSANGTPTGAFSFTDNGAGLAQATAVNGAASYTYSGTSAGAHNIVVTYVPTGAFAGSSASCVETVTALPTTSVLAVTPTNTSFGSPVMLTATVSPTTPPGPITPTGTVSFYNGTVSLGTVIVVNGVANLTLSSLPGGTDNLTCTYSGSSAYAASNCNTVHVTVSAAATSLSLGSSPNPAYSETPIVLTANLSSGGGPAAGNSVVFSIYAGTYLYAQATVSTDANGNAVFNYFGLPPDTYTLTASFAGNASLQSANSNAVTEKVIQAPTNTTLSVSPNPAYLGQTVTLTATVRSSVVSPNTPSGVVSFLDGTTLLGIAPTQSSNGAGVATLTTSTLSVGTHLITAGGPVSFAFSGSVSNTVAEIILASGFTIALSPSTLTIPMYKTGATTIQVASVGNYSGALTLSYGAPPQYASATIAPAGVTLPAGGTASSILTLHTLLLAQDAAPAKPGGLGHAVFYAAGFFVLLPLALRRRRRLYRALAVLTMAIAFQCFTGCTNAYYTPHFVSAGTYVLPITATDSQGNSQTATLTVVVTP